MENKSHEPAKKVSVSVARGTTQEIWMSVWEENCQGPNTGVPNEVELITIERWRFRSNKNATTLLTRTTEDWFRLARPPRAKIPLCLPYEGKLRLARRLRADSASLDVRGLAPPHPTSEGRLRLARRPRSGSASPDVWGQTPPRPTTAG